MHCRQLLPEEDSIVEGHFNGINKIKCNLIHYGHAIEVLVKQVIYILKNVTK